MSSIKLFAGTSHPELAEEIAKNLKVPLSPMEISRFACGEIYAKPTESIRENDVFVVQTASENVNEDLMELFIMLDSMKRSFAGKIHVVMPHFGYARQDRVATPREPISAKLVADLISAAGADHLITMKLHSDQEQGFFDFSVDNVLTEKLFADYFKKKNIKDLVVVSPDAGGAKDAKKFADLVGAELAIIHKSRPGHNKSEVMHVVGDVEDKCCLLYDDMVDTAGSVCNAIEALKAKGAKNEIYLCATHPVFSDPAAERLHKAGFKEVVVANTIPVSEAKQFKGLKVLSVAPLLARVIKNVHEGKSVTEAFNK
ncbi:ribose-phosphate pyrophosphokinase [Candidatus Peregrinibacteria bacterium]|jgi:ribose-phosphate pyrophosphokinase|nr:ribose-phosphate pyrophosphokinase [Candidatus Peregrinibacteria bacterium]MBT7736613.1 ribose-phosphate pyrophosphokinase [Candidatus Peregrinibacteria bacterium]